MLRFIVYLDKCVHISLLSYLHMNTILTPDHCSQTDRGIRAVQAVETPCTQAQEQHGFPCQWGWG